MTRITGTVARGLRAPIIRKGDDLTKIVCDILMEARETENLTLHNRDIVAVTESIVARAQGNYVSCSDVAVAIKDKFPGGEIGLIFPILSRNRFAIALKGIAMGVNKIYLQFSYPSDEVGNHLVTLDDLDAVGVDPYRDILSEVRWRQLFGYSRHQFTGVDYIEYYREIIESVDCEVEIIFANDARDILNYCPHVLCADIHSRHRSKRLLRDAGAQTIYGLDDILAEPVGDSGYNPDYGLLGSNKADEDSLKLFPRDCFDFAYDVQAELLDRTGHLLEVLVYGDGAFKDPIGKIWELADPIVSPGYTNGLNGQPCELKLKYLADHNFAHLKGEELKAAIKKAIIEKDHDLVGKMETQGTTPRQLTDLIGSLCDLVSGSGDKGTPVVLIQGYFDNYTTAE